MGNVSKRQKSEEESENDEAWGEKTWTWSEDETPKIRHQKKLRGELMKWVRE